MLTKILRRVSMLLIVALLTFITPNMVLANCVPFKSEAPTQEVVGFSLANGLNPQQVYIHQPGLPAVMLGFEAIVGMTSGVGGAVGAFALANPITAVVGLVAVGVTITYFVVNPPDGLFQPISFEEFHVSDASGGGTPPDDPGGNGKNKLLRQVAKGLIVATVMSNTGGYTIEILYRAQEVDKHVSTRDALTPDDVRNTPRVEYPRELVEFIKKASEDVNLKKIDLSEALEVYAGGFVQNDEKTRTYFNWEYQKEFDRFIPRNFEYPLKEVKKALGTEALTQAEFNRVQAYRNSGAPSRVDLNDVIQREVEKRVTAKEVVTDVNQIIKKHELLEQEAQEFLKDADLLDPLLVGKAQKFLGTKTLNDFLKKYNEKDILQAMQKARGEVVAGKDNMTFVVGDVVDAGVTANESGSSNGAVSTFGTNGTKHENIKRAIEITARDTSLRAYQADVLEKVYGFFSDGEDEITINLPTGTGKGYVISKLSENLKDQDVQIVVVTSRVKLVERFQSENKDWGSYFMNSKNEGMVTVTTYNSLKDLTRQYDVIIFDESHNVAAGSTEWLNKLERQPELVLYVSATPSIEQVQKPTIHISLVEAIRNGYLCDGVEVSFVRLKKSGEGSISYNQSENLKAFEEIIVYTLNKMDNNLNLMVRVPSITDAQSLAYYLKTNGFEAECIHSGLNQSMQNRLYDWFETPSETGNKIMIVVDMMVEGYDNPRVGGVLSLIEDPQMSVLTQFLGRGTRPLEGGKFYKQSNYLWMAIPDTHLRTLLMGKPASDDRVLVARKILRTALKVKCHSYKK